jgi:hypothetical protein
MKSENARVYAVLPVTSTAIGRVLIPGLVAMAVLSSWQAADAATVRWVGTCGPSGGYPTIQAAINAAAAGDTINVCPGIYTEHVAINKAGLTVVSTAGAYATKIAAPAAPVAPVVTITQPNASLVGFSLVPASSAAKYDIGVHVAIDGNASAQIAHNIVRGGRINVNLGCSSSGNTVYHNDLRGATESGINIDTCEGSRSGSTFNTVHHNTVCGGLVPYSIAAGGYSNFNAIHHNTAQWIYVAGNGSLVHDNVSQSIEVWPGSPLNATLNNTVAAVCP